MGSRYWLVINQQTFGRATYKHTSEQSAVSESERLARQSPGVTFLVVAVVGESITAPLFNRFDDGSTEPPELRSARPWM